MKLVAKISQSINSISQISQISKSIQYVNKSVSQSVNLLVELINPLKLKLKLN